MDITIFSIEQTGLSFQRFMRVRLLVWQALWAKAQIWKFSFLAELPKARVTPRQISHAQDAESFLPTFPTNKSVAWSLQTGDIVGSVALADGVVFFGTQDGNLYGVSTSDGKVLLNDSLPVGIWGGVTVADGYLITGASASAPGISNGAALGVYAYSLNSSARTTFSSSASANIGSSSSTRSSTAANSTCRLGTCRH